MMLCRKVVISDWVSSHLNGDQNLQAHRAECSSHGFTPTTDSAAPQERGESTGGEAAGAPQNREAVGGERGRGITPSAKSHQT